MYHNFVKKEKKKLAWSAVNKLFFLLVDLQKWSFSCGSFIPNLQQGYFTQSHFPQLEKCSMILRFKESLKVNIIYSFFHVFFSFLVIFISMFLSIIQQSKRLTVRFPVTFTRKIHTSRERLIVLKILHEKWFQFKKKMFLKISLYSQVSRKRLCCSFFLTLLKRDSNKGVFPSI